MTSGYENVRSVEGTEFKRIKVGVKQLEDAILNISSLNEAIKGHKYGNKSYILKCLAESNLPELRNISNFYYNLNGIYNRTCDYFAYLYRYDWYTMSEVYDNNVNEEKALKEFARLLQYLDNSYIKKICGDIALKVILEGAYYGYKVDSGKGMVLQDLPIEYCRSRYNVGGLPAVEFNMKYFDTFRDPGYRMRILKLFPDEFAKGYMLYRQNKLPPDFVGDNSGSWYLLDPNNAVKFNSGINDIPMFVKAIPALIDLDSAQTLDRRRQMQQLIKILIQKLPLDKNGDLIFDVDEARDIHNNAVQMLSRTIGVDVLTTFADIESVNLSDRNTTTTTDDLAKVERAVFNALGTSQNLFNTEGNLSLEKSILNDESSIRSLLFQFNMFFNRVVEQKNASKKYGFKFHMLETTQYNYKELSKLYKEQTQLGYSKLLPQIALGHSQSFILNSIMFENDVLHLSEIMIPPLMSSTLSSEDILGNKNKTSSQTNQNSTEGAGRPEKPDDQKSTKTIQNKESMS